MSDLEVFREVDEDYRRDRMMAFWKRYGGLVFAAFAVVVLAVVGINYWIAQSHAREEADTAEFEALLSDIKPGQDAQAIAAISAYAAKADPTKATLALFAQASMRQRTGNNIAAAQVYHQIADASQASDELKDLAVVRLGYIAADAEKPEPIMPRLQAIAAKASPWRFSAKEAIALLTARAGQRESAAKMFSDLAQDVGAPPNMAERARALAELYRGK